MQKIIQSLNLVNSVEKPSVKAFQKIAKSWDSLEVKLIPTKGIGGKKIPLIKDWANASLNRFDLEDFPSMDMLSILLERILVIDVDGFSAIEYLEALKILKDKDFETFIISSNPEERFALFFYLPEGVEIKPFSIPTNKEKGEQLEFRTGKQYQVIAGIHPKTNKPYLCNSLPPLVMEASPQLINFVQERKSPKISELSSEISNLAQDEISPKVEDIHRPLWHFLSRENKDFYREPFEGGRDVGCFKLACELLGLEQRLTELEIPYEGNAEDTYSSLWARMPKNDFDLKQFEKCFNQANQRERDVVIEDEYLYEIGGIKVEGDWEEIEDESNFEKEEDNQEDSTSQEEPKENKTPKAPKKGDLPPIEEIEEFLKNIKKYNPVVADKGAYQHLVSPLFRKHKFSTEHQKAIVDSLEKLYALDEVSPKDVEKFVNQPKEIGADDLRGFLGGDVFSKIENVAKVNGVPFHYALLSFITASSALVPKHYKFRWNGFANLKPNIFTLLVSRASYGKDLTFSPFSKPLIRKAEEINNKQKEINDELKLALQDWKEMSKGEKDEWVKTYLEQTEETFFDPSMPSKMKRDFYLKGNNLYDVDLPPIPAMNVASLPKINRLAGEQDDFGFLLAPSEIMDFVSKMNTIEKNKEGLNSLIPMWNGDSTLSNFKTDELRQRAGEYQVSLLTGIQTDRFRLLFDKSDPAGIASRCFYVFLKEALDPMDADEFACEEMGVKADLDKFFANFYDEYQAALLANIPFEVKDETKEYSNLNLRWRESKDSPITEQQRKFYAFRQECLALARDLKDKNQAAEQWLRRLAENCAKLIMNIQALRFGFNLSKSLTIVDMESVDCAIMLCRQFMIDYQNLNQCNFDPDSESFDEDLFMLVEFNDAIKRQIKKKKVKSVKASSLSGLYILEKKSFKDKYAPNESNLRRLKQMHVVQIFQELHDGKFGKFDKTKGEYTPLG